MDALNILFGGQTKVRMMRLFIFNAENDFDITDISLKLKISIRETKNELEILLKANLIIKKNFVKIIEKVSRGKRIEVKQKTHGFVLNQDFPYLSSLKQLLLNTKTFGGEEIIRRLSKAGKLKFVLISGIFIQNPDSRVDIMVVGDRIKRPIIDRAIKAIEIELGKELNYAYFEVVDFKYRTEMNDKLVRDILDFPHQVLLDKLSV
ncbi:MAG: hypothetical protein WC631_03650 [Candidatus Paceibacterota bacterium]|jgi:hypothetical protein